MKDNDNVEIPQRGRPRKQNVDNNYIFQKEYMNEIFENQYELEKSEIKNEFENVYESNGEFDILEDNKRNLGYDNIEYGMEGRNFMTNGENKMEDVAFTNRNLTTRTVDNRQIEGRNIEMLRALENSRNHNGTGPIISCKNYENRLENSKPYINGIGEHNFERRNIDSRSYGIAESCIENRGYAHQYDKSDDRKYQSTYDDRNSDNHIEKRDYLNKYEFRNYNSQFENRDFMERDRYFDKKHKMMNDHRRYSNYDQRPFTGENNHEAPHKLLEPEYNQRQAEFRNENEKRFIDEYSNYDTTDALKSKLIYKSPETYSNPGDFDDSKFYGPKKDPKNIYSYADHFMNTNWMNRKKRKNNPFLWQYLTKENHPYIIPPSEYSSVEYVNADKSGQKMYLGTMKRTFSEKNSSNNTILPLFLNSSSYYESKSSLQEFDKIAKAFLGKTDSLDYENVTVQQLKVLMKEFGLSHTGKKLELIDRVKQTVLLIRDKIKSRSFDNEPAKSKKKEYDIKPVTTFDNNENGGFDWLFF